MEHYNDVKTVFDLLLTPSTQGTLSTAHYFSLHTQQGTETRYGF